MKLNRRFLNISATLVALGVALAIGWYIGSHTAAPPAGEREREVLYWHDPMVPGAKFDKPGKSPFMDMDLVPVYADEVPSGEAIVTVRPEIMNSLGVRTAPVTRGRPARELTTQGYLVHDEGLLVLVDVFERDRSWVRTGLAAAVRLPEYPGREWPAVVQSVERDVDIGARSVKARIRLTRVDKALAPNLLADVVVRAPPAAAGALYIPRDALIRTGTRTAVVTALGEGRFQPVEVMAGSEVGDFIEIAEGLKEGDRVVVSGQFLIDSEASARTSFTRMEPASPEAAPAIDPHAGHQH